MAGKTIMAFGAFDGLHPGNIHYLQEAKKLGDRLIVVVSPDKTAWKFPIRFQLPEKERIELVRLLGIADEVMLGSTTDALERIIEQKPDVIAITHYHPVDPQLLQLDLQKRGLAAKVIEVPVYKPEIYDAVFSREARVQPNAAHENTEIYETMLERNVPAGEAEAVEVEEQPSRRIAFEERMEKELLDVPDKGCALLKADSDSLLKLHLAAVKLLSEKFHKVIVISANRPYTTLLHEYGANGIDFGKVLVVDCISKSGVGKNEWVRYIGNVSNLSSIAISVKEALNRIPGDRFVLLDSVSTMMIYNDRELFARFLHRLLTDARATGAGCLLLTDKSADKVLLKEVEEMCDKTIEI